MSSDSEMCEVLGRLTLYNLGKYKAEVEKTYEK